MSIIWTNNDDSSEASVWLLPSYDVDNPPDFANDPDTPDFIKDLMNNGILSLYTSATEIPNDLWKIDFPEDPNSSALSAAGNYMVMMGVTVPMAYNGTNYMAWDKTAFEMNYTENP